MRKIFEQFIFNGESSDTYGVRAVFFGGSPDTSYSAGLATELSAVRNNTLGTFDIVEQNYSQPLQFTLQIVNSDFSDFDVVRERDIKKWLCKRGVYGWFSIENDGYEDIWWKVNIANPKAFYIGRVVGLEFECTADAPFGYSPLIQKSFQVTAENNTVPIYIHTDEKDNYIYPYMEITMAEPGNLEITNSTETEHRAFVLNHVVKNEVITIDNSLPDILSSQNGHNVYSDFNHHWIRLADKKNVLTFNLPCSVTIKYREIRKAGIYS